MPDRVSSDRLLTVPDVAEYLGLAEGTVRNKVSSGEIPYLKVGGAVRFRRADIDAWIEAQNADRTEKDPAA